MLNDALIMLNRLVRDNGWEFPDAAYKAASHFGVKQSQLEEAYDAQFNV